jgi:hypothetical protein
MNNRELRKMLESIASEAGTRLLRIDVTRRHRRVLFDNGRVLICGSTLSDRRAIYNIRSMARRLLRAA